MTAGTAGKLYTPQLLGLATGLANYPLGDRDWPQRAQGRSRTCGSTIILGVETGDDGIVTAVGMRISACAVGQASAALLARSICGRRGSELVSARNELAEWLEGRGALPDWHQIDILAPAREYPARHGAILLSWNAVTEALSLASSAS